MRKDPKPFELIPQEVEPLGKSGAGHGGRQMTNATKAFHDRLVVIFDFDQTLAPDSYHALLGQYGLDPQTFDRERVQPLAADGWDHTLARFYCLISGSKARADRHITRDFVEQGGRKRKARA